MCLSVFFAQIIGLYLLVLSLSALIHPDRFRKILYEIMSSPTLVATVGCKSLLIGLIILVPHDLWVCKWPVLITLIGWIMTLRGMMLLLFPGVMTKFFKKMIEKKGLLFFSWIWFLIAAYLVWLGFSK